MRTVREQRTVRELKGLLGMKHEEYYSSVTIMTEAIKLIRYLEEEVDRLVRELREWESAGEPY